ncbi:hypothetical protein BDW66DRAFT_168487 [Aspergillus desertorum]
MIEMNIPSSLQPDRSTIPLTHMPQQAHVWKSDDDWTGVVDRRERRKLQNRQNQRKWRMHRSQDLILEINHISIASTTSVTLTVSTGTVRQDDEDGSDVFCGHAPPHALAYLRSFEASLRQSYRSNSPQLDHLIDLTRLNVHRAIRENMRAIGMTIEWTICDDSISIFNVSPPSPALNLDKIPLSLRPTEIQKSMPHQPWLDFFPFPSMRDTLISAAHLFDDEELCHDLMAFWNTRDTQATLIVWGASWEPGSWEVTEGFARKWGWLLRGCPELLVSTNIWRSRRGERPLNRRRILACVYE